MYSAKDVARLLDLTVGQIRSYARSGVLEPQRGPHGEYRFSFQDLVLLRTAKGLVAQRIAPQTVRRALTKLKQELPQGRPLSGLQIVGRGDRVLVRRGSSLWEPETGQAEFDFDFDFDVAELAEQVAPQAVQAIEKAIDRDDELSAEEWFELGADLEAATPEHAREAYRRALELDPNHVESRVNLGRLLHELGRIEAADAHYRIALAADPTNVTAAFNLAVALEDRNRDAEAIDVYLDVVRQEPDYADAYYNLARLYEKSGESKAALRNLSTYRRLTD